MRLTAQFCNPAFLLLCFLARAAAFTHPAAKVSARSHLKLQQRLFQPQKARCLVTPLGKLWMAIDSGYNSAPTTAEDNGGMVRAIPKDVKDKVVETLNNKDDLSLVAYVAEFYKDLFIKQKVGELEQTVQQLLARVKALEEKGNTVSTQPKAPIHEKKPVPLAQHSFSPIQQGQHPRQQQQLQPFQQQGRNAWQAYLRSTMKAPTSPVPPSSGYQIPHQQPRQPATQNYNARHNVKTIPVHRAADYDEYAAPAHHNQGANEVSDEFYDDEYYDDSESEYDEFFDDDIEKVGANDHHARYSPQSHHHNNQHRHHEQQRRAEVDQHAAKQSHRQPEIHRSAQQHAAYPPVQSSFHPQRSERTTSFG